MKGIYTQKNSPYYWLRYYDQLEQDPNRKRKSVNTKIPITPADKRRISDSRKNGQKVQLQGTAELRKLLREFRSGLTERTIASQDGCKVSQEVKFLLKVMKNLKKREAYPEVRNHLKEKT